MTKKAMPIGWKETTLGEIGIIITGKTPSTKHSEYFDGEVPFVTPHDMDDRKYISSTERYLSQEGVDAVKNAFLPKKTIMVSCIGSDMGKVAISQKSCVTNQQINSIIVNEDICTEYVYYDLSLRQTEIKLKASGSAVPILNKGHFSNLSIFLPSLPEQKAIAHILGTLDDKIELNRRMNETLEAMARAIYKSWFVDFDPVRAKVEGRKPSGMNAEIAKLFPDSFEGSELGKIPKRWKVTSLSDLFPNDKNCVITGPFGSNLHASDYRPEGVPLILVKHVLGGRIINNGMPKVGSHKFPEMNRYMLDTGDIVFTRVGAVGRSAYVFPHQKYWLISGQMLRVRVSDQGKLNSRYLAQVYLEPSFMEMVESHALGTTRPSLNTKILSSFRFIYAQPQAQQAFAETVAYFDMRRQKNLEESETLSSIRDALLPKLLSGEIRVKDAEKYMEAV